MNNITNLDLVDAAQKSDFEKIKTIASTQKDYSFDFNDNEIINILAQKSQWDLIKYLAQSLEVKKPAYLPFESLLKESILQDNFEVFKWLAQSSPTYYLEKSVMFLIERDKFEYFKYLLENTKCPINLHTDRLQYHIDLVRYVASKVGYTDSSHRYIHYLLIEHKDKDGSYYYFRYADKFYESAYYSNEVKLYVAKCLEERKPFIHDSLLQKVGHLLE